MEEPLTDELLQELLGAPTPQAFTEKYRHETHSLSQYLEYLLEKHSLSRVAVVRAAGLNETFGYQIFKGQRKASRNKILQLVFAMHLTLQEGNRLLQAAGVNELYCKNRRDAIIIFCLNREYVLQQVDEELYRFGEETIC
ncbi:MAG: XRE family transcriptional regulator [Raoultibacter sp.]